MLSCSVIYRGLALQSLTNCRGLTHLPTKRKNISYRCHRGDTCTPNSYQPGRHWQPNDLWELSHFLANRSNGKSCAQLPTYLIRLLDVLVALLKVRVLLPVAVAVWVMGEEPVKGLPGSWQVVLQERHNKSNGSSPSKHLWVSLTSTIVFNAVLKRMGFRG